ncbi:hypothetical protein T492DRAFT_938215 [Pavlovales sp. CCMP2436]|nr:hypothetical protein T492DRAFT_938215 [Pavlovales sp. CCMP2436]|mmetsp:Transcript_9974/g.25069  ORF Transcript_9974/g.25069 Transcript_9974/m.25069 type:complete len:292 (-) Transcript_9974:191-1066(-)
MAGKVNFKQLMKVQATPEAGGGLGKIKEHRERLLALKQQAPGQKRPAEAAPSSQPKRVAPPPASPAAAEGPGFTASAAYAGSRPGYAFTSGALGTGYYRDTSQPPPPAAASARVVAFADDGPAGVPPGFFDDGVAPAASGAQDAPPHAGDDGAQPASSLPSGFFDNPREDPANATRKAQVSETKKGELLRQELASFEKSIEPEVEVADAVDELEDEAEGEYRAAEHDREQYIFAARGRALREEAERVRAAARRAAPAAGTAAANGSTEAEESGSDGEGSDLLVDWRSKRRI